MENRKKVLVAGATGYLGRYVVQEFKRQGYWVRALARNAEKLSIPGPYSEPAVDKLADDIFIGEITKPETLRGLCDGIDLVFSSIGITRQRDGLSFMDVDYRGNRNLLNIALQASVKRFIFVSVFKADTMLHLVKARELFVRELRQSGLEYRIVRPTGYFSDMSEYLKMARSGRVFLVDKGKARINPIHGEDLAKVCVQVSQDQGNTLETNVGGPEVFSYRQIAELAFETLESREKIWHLPIWLLRGIVHMIRPFNKQLYQMVSFFMTVMSNDFIAPQTGSHSLRQYFDEIAN